MLTYNTNSYSSPGIFSDWMASQDFHGPNIVQARIGPSTVLPIHWFADYWTLHTDHRNQNDAIRVLIGQLNDNSNHQSFVPRTYIHFPPRPKTRGEKKYIKKYDDKLSESTLKMIYTKFHASCTTTLTNFNKCTGLWVNSVTKVCNVRTGISKLFCSL